VNASSCEVCCALGVCVAIPTNNELALGKIRDDENDEKDGYDETLVPVRTQCHAE
jgi:hypothetical protein